VLANVAFQGVDAHGMGTDFQQIVLMLLGDADRGWRQRGSREYGYVQLDVAETLLQLG
jgi:hypothetical protein